MNPKQLSFADYTHIVNIQPHSVRETAPAQLGEAVASVVSHSTLQILPHLITEAAETWLARLTDGQRKAVATRYQRALLIAHDVASIRHTDTYGVYAVKSQDKNAHNIWYTVDLRGDKKTCDCPDDFPACKHIIAAHILTQAVETSIEKAREFAAQAEAQLEAEAETQTAEVTEEAVKAIKVQRPTPETVIYAICVTQSGSQFAVEILESLDDKKYLVRALPHYVDHVLTPRFPFPSPYTGREGVYSTGVVSKNQLRNVKIFINQRDGN